MKDRLSPETLNYGVKTIELVDAVFQWCESLRGLAPIQNSLKSIADGLGAEAIAVSRITRGSEHKSMQICYDRKPPKAAGQVLNRSFAEALIGEYLNSVRPGTIWLRSDVEREANPALDGFHARRKLREMAIIPLANRGTSTDFMELHFGCDLAPDQHALLNTLAVTFSKSWATRDMGVFLKNMPQREYPVPLRKEAESLPTGTDVLSIENPARLSRAEYRVCLLLSRGLQVKEICRELTIAEPTIRSHLRNIYAKTFTSTMPELLHLILNGMNRGAVVRIPRVA